MTTSTAEILDTMRGDYDPFQQSEHDKARHSIRFPKLDDESQQNFVVGFKNFISRSARSPEAIAQRDAFLKSKGLSGADKTNVDFEEASDTMLEDPVFAARTRLSRSAQIMMWDRAHRVFHRDADHYLSEMEKTDASGPGALELNPEMDIPDYARHEIHNQPGGFVGDPFAGWLYHYAVNLGFYQGKSDHDEIHLAIAKAHPLPPDGQVRRVLDMGCGTGQSTTSIKERFPNAEVWGIDAGGPMVRYAHYRAVKLGIDVNFAQRMAEDTKFPDGYFDLVTDHIMFHEVTADVAKDIIKEVYRILRPGGVFNHVDRGTAGHPHVDLGDTIPVKAGRWLDCRLNVEPWTLQYQLSDFPGNLRKAGFEVDVEVPSNRWNMYPGLHAYKPV
jgi:SAM-dependent methyltransferase